MSKSLPVVNAATDTFGAAFTKYNNIVTFCNTEVVTVNATGGVTTGNGHIAGSFSTNVFSTFTLSGGNTTVNTAVNVVTNVIFRQQVNAMANLVSNGYIFTTKSFYAGTDPSAYSELNGTWLNMGNSTINAIMTSSYITISNDSVRLLARPGVLAIGANVTVDIDSFKVGNSSNYSFVNSSVVLSSDTGTLNRSNASSMVIQSSTDALRLSYLNMSIGNSSTNTNINSISVATTTLSGNLDTSYLTGIISPTNISGAYTGIRTVGNLTTLIVNNSMATFKAGLTAIASPGSNALVTTGNNFFGGNVRVNNNIVIDGDLVVSGNVVYSNSSVGFSNVIAVASGYYLGNTINRWNLFANSGSFTNTLVILGDLNSNGLINSTKDITAPTFNGNVISTSTKVSSVLTIGATNDVENRALTVTSSAIGSQVIDTFISNSYRSAKYVIQVTDNTANNLYASEILLLQDGLNTYITEYASLISNNSIGTFSSNVSSGIVRLYFNSTVTNSTVKLFRTLFQV